MSQVRGQHEGDRKSEAAAEGGRWTADRQAGEVKHPTKPVAGESGSGSLSDLAGFPAEPTSASRASQYFVGNAPAPGRPDIENITKVLGYLPAQTAQPPAGQKTGDLPPSVERSGLFPDVRIDEEALPDAGAGFTPSTPADAAALDTMFGTLGQAAPVAPGSVAADTAKPAAPAETAAPVERPVETTRPVQSPPARVARGAERVVEHPPLAEEFPEIADSGTKSGTRFIQFEQIGDLELMEQIAWAIRWLVYLNDREARYPDRYFGTKYKKGYGERGGILDRLNAAIENDPANPAFLLIRGGLLLQSNNKNEEARDKEVSAGVADIMRSLVALQNAEGVSRVRQVLAVLGTIPMIGPVKPRIFANIKAMPHFAELAASYGVVPERTSASRDEPVVEPDAPGEGGLTSTGHLTPEGELVETTSLLIEPQPSEAEADADFQRQVSEEAYEASRTGGGGGGYVPPTGGGGRGAAGGFFEDGEGWRLPRSEIRKRIEKMIADIKDALHGGFFRLSGDDPETGEHSAAVNEAIERTLDFFDIEITDRTERIKAEGILFRAFMIYRGVGVDSEGRIFARRAEDARIYDDTFIDFLEEIRENTRNRNARHPFFYSKRDKKLGGTYVFPVIADRETAEFFTRGGIKEMDGMTADEFIDFTVKQWYNQVEPLLRKRATGAQREAVWALFDAIAEDSDHPDANPRSPDARVSMSELLRADSLYARMWNSEKNLADAMSDRVERQIRAMERNERNRKRKGESKHNPLTPGQVVDDPSGFWERLTDPNVEGAARIIANIGRTMGVIFMPMIGVTGIVEGGTGVVVQSWGTRLLKMVHGHRWSPTERTKEITRGDEAVVSLGEIFDIISWKGMDAALDAASHLVKFTKAARRAEEGPVGQQPLLGKISERTEGLLGAAMSWSTGDWAWNRARAQVFIENYIYQLERSARKGGLVITPQQVEAAMESNLDDFLRQVIETPEGRAALLHAVNTSIGGIDPLSEALRRATRNQLVDTALGFTVGWYLKFGIRSPLRMIPFSNTAIFALKRGLINPAMVHSGLRDEGWVRDSNESMFGANDEFAEGFFQNVIIDLARFGTQAGTYAFVYALISLLGGLEPPDDEDKDHLWYEYKIQGRAFKENWYWLEILGFAMPFAVAMHVGGSTGDMGKVKEILFDNGIWEKLGDSPWDNVTDYVELINNFDQRLIEAQSVSEGYKDQVPVSKDEFIFTQFMVMLGRRGYQTFEPAIVRALYNERGLGRGINDLARSPNVVYTPDPEDGDKTEMTSWQDAQKRRMAMPSPGMGRLLNLISGYDAANPEIQETGYLRKEMPLIANVDPTNMMWVTELSVLDEEGDFVPADQWSDEEIRIRVQTVLDLLDKKTPSELAANGVVIPYDARAYTMAELNRQWKEARAEYDTRMENGEFDYKRLGIEFKDARKMQNDSWAEVEEKREAIDRLKEMLFSDEIPYSAMKYNRWETNYRTLYRWKEGTPKEGQPATAFDYRLHGDKIDVEWYPSGDHKSGFLPWLSVDDKGRDTYDAQAQVGWQTDQTDMEFVRSTTEGKTIPQGMFEGQDLWGTLTGGGAVGPGARGEGSWDKDKLLFGARAYQPARVPEKKLDRDDFKVSDDDKKTGKNTDTDGGYRTWRRRGWGGGGGDWSPKVYSNPAYSLNADKPAGLFRRPPQRPRYDYLRPSVQTKGSREAYRREDI